MGAIITIIVRHFWNLSDDCRFWALCLVIVLPFCRCHARLFFEVAGHGLIVGKARFDGDGGYFHLRTFEQQAFGMFHTVFIDELRQGTASDGLHAIGDIAAVDAKGRGNVGYFQPLLQIELLLVHQVTDALHQLLVTLGDSLRRFL